MVLSTKSDILSSNTRKIIVQPFELHSVQRRTMKIRQVHPRPSANPSSDLLLHHPTCPTMISRSPKIHLVYLFCECQEPSPALRSSPLIIWDRHDQKVANRSWSGIPDHAKTQSSDHAFKSVGDLACPAAAFLGDATADDSGHNPIFCFHGRPTHREAGDLAAWRHNSPVT
jgi:hypothetical protein